MSVERFARFQNVTAVRAIVSVAVFAVSGLLILAPKPGDQAFDPSRVAPALGSVHDGNADRPRAIAASHERRNRPEISPQ